MGFGSNSSSGSNNSQQSSQSYNQSYPFLQSALGDQVGYVGKGNSAIADLLGLNGPTGQTAGLERLKESSGYNFIRDEGVNGIIANKAAKGLIGSGSTLKGITEYNNNLANTYLDKYLASLTGLSNNGLGAGQILASAGSTANSQGTSYGTNKSSGFQASL